MKIVGVKQDNKQLYESRRGEVEDFLKLQKASLLQSFDWREFQESLKRKNWHFIILNEENIIASALVVKYSLPLGKSYLYCNRGPVIENINSDLKIKALKLLLKKIKEIAEQEDSIFFRLDPEWDDIDENRELLNNLELKKSKKEINPKNTLILDISRSEEEILAQMHSKTRYNIKLAKRKGIQVRISHTSSIGRRGGDNFQSFDKLRTSFPISNENKDFNKFWELMEETTKRDGFSSHPKEYYKKQLEILSKNNLVKLFIAELGSEIVSAVIVSFYNDNAVYLHGASGYRHRKYMAPHLIQWEAIREAKKRGCLYYDFWGIEGENRESIIKNQDWGGITRFKKGFAKDFGIEKNYIGAWDLPLQKIWYGIYNLIRR